MDAQSLENLKFVYPDIRVRSFRAREDIHKATGYWIRVTQGFRSFETQDNIYKMGRSIPGPNATKEKPLGDTVTDSRPGLSFHNFGLAFDVCFIGLDPYLETMAKMRGAEKAEVIWERIAECFEANGLISGRRFRLRKDSPHAELSYGLRLSEIVELYEHGGLAAVWTQCDKIRGASGEWNPDSLPAKEVRVS